MIISFDIDNTLIAYSNEFEAEPQSFLAKLLGAEKLRKGTKDLFRYLEKEGHEIWIYTTSYRSIFSLRKTFQLQGLRPKRYINETINRKTLDAQNCKASKNPKLFGIDLHIDDSEGVGIEGKRYGFEVLVIRPDNVDWVEATRMDVS